MNLLKNNPLNYSIQFIFNKEPLLFRKIFGNVNILFSTNTMISFEFNDYLINAEEIDVPIQILLIKESCNSSSKKILSLIKNTQLDDASINCINKSNFLLDISDFMATTIDYKKRIYIFNQIFKTLIQLLPCEMVYWSCSQKLLKSDCFFDILEKEFNYNNYGTINVRYFKKNNYYVMDTIGLSSIGLPDLQCSFINIEPGIISAILYEYGRKIFEQGDFLEDDEEIYSMNINFLCKHKYSTTYPKRIVIELQPI